MPPYSPVVDPELPQRTGKQENNWVLVLLGIFGVWLAFCLVAFCCFRPAFATATVDCDDEPDRLREPEKYKRWQRECEERQRRPKLSLAFSDADITRYHTVAS
jgi:hypothetical protein